MPERIAIRYTPASTGRPEVTYEDRDESIPRGEQVARLRARIREQMRDDGDRAAVDAAVEHSDEFAE